MGSEIESLKLAFSTNTNWAEWAAVAVFVGLLGDISVILIFDLFDKDKSWWEIILAGIASLIIAGGVWGESHFGHRATDASTRIQTILENETADANERAALAMKAAESDRLARVQLEQKMAWRHLSAKQRAELPKAFAPLKGVAVVLSAQATDPEASGFAKEIEAALQEAGIKVSNQIGLIMAATGVLPSGLWIQVTPDDLSKQQGLALLRALQSEGIAARGALLPAPKPEKDKPPNRTVQIFVGGRSE